MFLSGNYVCLLMPPAARPSTISIITLITIATLINPKKTSKHVQDNPALDINSSRLPRFPEVCCSLGLGVEVLGPKVVPFWDYLIEF